MSLSVGMNSALLSLIDVNSQISTVSNQLQTGKRFNSAADGAVQWLQITDFTNRAASLTTVNDSLSVAMTQTKSASTSLAAIRAKLVSTQTSLNDAYTSQAAVHGTNGTTDTPSSILTKFNLNFTLDPNGSLKSFTGTTTLDGNVLINNSRVHVGDAFTIGVGTQALSFKIAKDSATVDATSQKALQAAQDKLDKDTTDLGLPGTPASVGSAAVSPTGFYADKASALDAMGTTASTLSNAGLLSPTNLNRLASNTFNNWVNAAAAQQIATFTVPAGSNTAGVAPSTLTIQQYADGLRAIARGDQTPSISNIPNSQQWAQSEIKRLVGSTSTNGDQTSLKNYLTAASKYDEAVQKITSYSDPVSGVIAQDKIDLNNVRQNQQTGDALHPYLVATVADYVNILTKLKTSTNQSLINVSAPAPDDNSPITQFSATATIPPDSLNRLNPLSIARIGTGNVTDIADVRNLFQSNLALTATDTTKQYDIGNWEQNGNVFKLSAVRHTGSTPGTVTTAADAKRKVAANTFRQTLKDINQTVKDTAINGFNLLTGSKLSVALNAEGDKFDFQLTADNSGAATFDSKGLGLDINAANVNNGTGGTNNNFDNNTDMDTALAQITTALASIDTATGLVGDAQNSLQNRSSFNKTMADLLNSTASSLSSVDTNDAAARLAALQTRQQFATSIMSIIKQGEQNPLQLLR